MKKLLRPSAASCPAPPLRLAALVLVLAGLAATPSAVLGSTPQSSLRPEAQPAEELRLDDRTPYDSLSSSNPFGARGERLLDVSTSVECGQESWVFARAELHIQNARYGRAEIIQAPARGCTTCDPLRIRWYHEPAGALSFTVNVLRQRMVQPCNGRPPNKPSVKE